MQEGRARCSGRSGLATGTENRREMRRVERGRDSKAGREGEKREGRHRVGDKESLQVTLCGGAITTGGPKAADAAIRGRPHEGNRALGFGKR